jgi:hypothetical protein
MTESAMSSSSASAEPSARMTLTAPRLTNAIRVESGDQLMPNPLSETRVNGLRFVPSGRITIRPDS